MPTQQDAKSNESRNPQTQDKSLSRNPQRNLGAAYGMPFGWTPGDFFRSSPLSMLRRMSEEMDRAFGGRSAGIGNGGQWSPAIEVNRRDGNYVVSAELPGIDPSKVKVEVTPDAIVIEGERESKKEEKREGVEHCERCYGAFYRSIPLPEGANAEQAHAKFDNGVLEVSVPVKETAQRRQIPIESAGKGAQPQGSKAA